MKLRYRFLGILFFLLAMTIHGQELSVLANNFIETLSPELKAETLMNLDNEERLRFNFVPIKRKGVTFKDFNETQKEAAIALLKASLSEDGYKKTVAITQLENVLIVLENNELKMPDGSPMRDPLNYHFLVFKDKSNDTFWGWSFEGHHISLNFIAQENKILSSTPSFLGSNPAIVPSGPHKGKEVLKEESEMGFKLVNALSNEQLNKALISSQAPRDIISGTRISAENLEPYGISYAELSTSQQKALKDLIHVYINNYESEFGKSFWDKINTSGVEGLSFAWAGSLTPGKAHYYRIQSPVILIEYDNTQNNANHVHTVVRDLSNDFGSDVLKAHYEESHKH